MPEQIYSRILKSGDVLFQEGEEGDNVGKQGLGHKVEEFDAL